MKKLSPKSLWQAYTKWTVVTTFLRPWRRGWTGLSGMLFYNFLFVKSSSTKYFLNTFSNRLNLSENGVDVVAPCSVFSNVWVIFGRSWTGTKESLTMYNDDEGQHITSKNKEFSKFSLSYFRTKPYPVITYWNRMSETIHLNGRVKGFN